ncbi:MFS transporter [Propioniciclava sp. MC1683]|uniref:MFS transporter n=1 Tax=Propioniciclava sp. MC1683 TaxID=2760309 RepID=UPI0015FF88C7|nr:MFS transporter [Propioniciclava sp. MC1683]MBB1501796.1 MFS transporter [Propioniciclava sp. MC1683]
MSAARRWSALAVLILPVLLISIDMTVLGIAVPALSADLKPTSTQLLWIFDLYSFLLAGLLVLMGSVGDRIGRRRLLLIGAPLFGLASVMAAFATSPEMLIAARALLGLGGATLMPSTLGLLRSIFPERGERRIAIAIWAASFSGGAAIGPVLGGALIEQFWWGSVFLINAPIMLVFVLACALLVPESRDPHPGPFDPASALLVIAGLLGVVYALKTAVKDPSWPVALTLVGGVALLWVFVRRQRRLANPMIDVRLFTEPGFSGAVTTNVLAVFALVGAMFFLPQYLMLVHGMNPALAGMWLLPLAIATVVGALTSPALARVLPVRGVVVLGLLISAAGFAVATRLNDGAGIAVFPLASVLLGLGIGLAETLTNDVILTAAPPQRAGAASAISETGYEFGGAMGTAVLGTIGLAVYARGLDDVPGVSAAQLSAARQTLGAAYELADTLPAGVGDALRASAADAFLAGMNVTMAVGVAVLLLAGVVAGRWLVTREELGLADAQRAVAADGDTPGATATREPTESVEAAEPAETAERTVSARR